MHLYWFYFEQS